MVAILYTCFRFKCDIFRKMSQKMKGRGGGGAMENDYLKTGLQ